MQIDLALKTNCHHRHHHQNLQDRSKGRKGRKDRLAVEEKARQLEEQVRDSSERQSPWAWGWGKLVVAVQNFSGLDRTPF